MEYIGYTLGELLILVLVIATFAFTDNDQPWLCGLCLGALVVFIIAVGLIFGWLAIAIFLVITLVIGFIGVVLALSFS